MLARENPFSTSKIKKIPYQWVAMSPAWLFTRLQENKFRGCILGNHGSGKSTLLRALKELIESKGLRTDEIFINDEKRIGFIPLIQQLVSAHHSSSILLIDGADLLSRLCWVIVRVLSFNMAGIVVTSHERKLLPLLWHCVPQESVVRDIAGRLTEGQLQVDIDILFAKHSGNIREIFRELYDEYSSLSK
jgi:energy-coupling factor transporter ATP-binding protein EcfA2